MKRFDFGRKEKALPVGHARVDEALEILEVYRSAKRRTDERIRDEMLWWQRRHDIKKTDGYSGSRPVSAWLFNSIVNKHADMCDNIPTAEAIPREERDERAAELLSDILPVICNRCGLEEVYSDNAWYKLRHGMAAYGVFWNSKLENGLGDIDIRRLDVLDIFWDVSVRDIQDSPNLFIVAEETLANIKSAYPDFVSKGTDENGKLEVVDWYYKLQLPSGRTLLHYAKICDGELLYASENDELLFERGWYEHGKYPVVIDRLFPEVNGSTGYGYLAVGRNPQGYIDELDGHILEYANWASRARYWAKRSLGVNERDFLNPDKRIIEVEGDIDEEKLRQITVTPIDSTLTTVRTMKINELKETTGNRDFSQGGTSGGITAAAAINALQEAGHKESRDLIVGTYRAYVKVIELVIELIRQFYDGERCFRIGRDTYRYVKYDNSGIKVSPVGEDRDGELLCHRPIFDIEVRAEHQDPLSKNAKNELMLQLFKVGMFDPENRHAAITALDGMDFEGIGSVRRLVLSE